VFAFECIPCLGSEAAMVMAFRAFSSPGQAIRA
jgi:hypothetical protein